MGYKSRLLRAIFFERLLRSNTGARHVVTDYECVMGEAAVAPETEPKPPVLELLHLC